MQIWQHNIYHANIIAIKDVIILEKAQKRQSINIIDTIMLAKMAEILSLNNFTKKYMLVINNIDINVVKKLGLTNVNKH